jgi:hypothetical protein
MGWVYSVDPRERVIAAFDVEDMTDEQVASRRVLRPSSRESRRRG